MQLDVRCSADRNSGTAAAIIGEWNAPVTGSPWRAAPAAWPRPPRPRASRASPESTTCWGELSLATDSPCACASPGALLRRARAHQRQHAASPLLTRFLHQAAAKADQPQAVGLGQRSGRDQRAQLPQRMAGHELAVGPAQRAPAGQAGAEDRGLGVLGSVLRAGERILPHHLLGQLEQIRAGAGDSVTHVRCLTALAGKQDRGNWHA